MQEDSRQEKAETRRSRSEHIGIGTVFVAMFMCSSLLLLADTLWPFLPDSVECILGVFVAVTVWCALIAGFFFNIEELIKRLFGK